ncbi:phospholipase D family protein, partial [Lyngbya aestuarii BL J]
MHLLKKKRLLISLAILLALLFLGRLLLDKKPSQSTLQPLRETLPQEPLIQAYFNQSQASVYTEPYRQQTRFGDDLEQIIIDSIKTANSSVDVAVQELRLPKIAEVLANRHQAGVKVRIILENSYSRPWSFLSENEVAQLSQQERDRYLEAVQLIDINQDGQLSTEEINQRDALVILNNTKIPLIDDTADGSKGSGLMHHKFVIVDGKTVIVTSANFTLSGTHGDLDEPESRGNANNLLKIESSQLARLFTQEFNLMWGDGPGGEPDSLFGTKKPDRRVENITVGNTPVFVQFAPTTRSQTWENSVNGLIAKTLTQAQESIDFALFVFSDQRLVDVMETTVQRSITLQGIIDPGFAYRNYSEMLDMMGVAAVSNCKYEAKNRPWKQPISTVGVPNLSPGDKLHHKFGIVDNQVVISGSQNWTEAANTTNDETLIVIKNSAVAAHFNREFNRLYNTATLGLPGGILAKFKRDIEACQGNIETVSKPPRWS